MIPNLGVERVVERFPSPQLVSDLPSEVLYLAVLAG